MRAARIKSYALMALLIVALARVGSISAQVIQDSVPELQGIDVVEHLGEMIPLNLTFTNDAGEQVALDHYFHQGKPVILTMAYYTCPMLCTVVLNGLSDGVRQLDWLPGKDFTMLTVSIDPKESLSVAWGKRTRYVGNLGKSSTCWRFMIGEESQSKALAEAIGFKYYYDEEQKQYAHPAVAFVVGEDGKISRYLYGIEFKPNDLKLALLEASQGKIGNTIDRLILYCYHYWLRERIHRSVRHA
jgi:protein SCO1/2